MSRLRRRGTVTLSLCERGFCSRSEQATSCSPSAWVGLVVVAAWCAAVPALAAAPSTDDAGGPLVQPEGEDAGAGQGGAGSQDSLKLVKDRMRTAESVLAARDASGRASSAQQEAVSELDAMIAKLQKQCENCGGQCNKPPGPPQNKSPKPGGKKGAKPGETSAVAATKPAPPVDKAAVGNLVKNLWGRLPERQREELLQPLSEEFLPEYAADIEEYFRVLAEAPNEKATETRP
jgi:hypothetical protein